MSHIEIKSLNGVEKKAKEKKIFTTIDSCSHGGLDKLLIQGFCISHSWKPEMVARKGREDKGACVCLMFELCF